MPYFEPSVPAEPVPYFCPNCKAWYVSVQREGPRMGCLVYHAPGSCCHFAEKEVPEPQNVNSVVDLKGTEHTPKQED